MGLSEQALTGLILTYENGNETYDSFNTFRRTVLLQVFNNHILSYDMRSKLKKCGCCVTTFSLSDSQ